MTKRKDIFRVARRDELPELEAGITLSDMGQDRDILTIDLAPSPGLREQLEKEADSYSKKVGVKVSIGAYVRRLIETHPEREKKGRK